jgi:hypothetical protein
MGAGFRDETLNVPRGTMDEAKNKLYLETASLLSARYWAGLVHRMKISFPTLNGFM